MHRIPFCGLLLGGLMLCSNLWGDVVINEIMYNPRANQDNSEYLELYNTGTSPADLSGWSFKEGIDFTFPEGTSIEAQGYLVVCRNEIFLRTFYALGDTVQTVGNFAPSNLSNSGETIRLEDADGTEIDRVEYSDSDPWPTQADGSGASLELIHPLADNDNVVYWKDSYVPTPGKPNSRLINSIPPRILQIRRTPQAPSDTESVLVEVVMDSSDTLSAVTLSYSVQGGFSQTLAMTAQGSTYSASIAPQKNGSTVQYSITASNPAGYTITLPAGVTQNRYSYQVNNNPPSPGAVVINEIMYNNPTAEGEDEEWIELFNPSSQAIDLSSWILQDSNGMHQFYLPSGTQLAAQGFLLISKTKSSAWKGTVITGLTFSLDNDGDTVSLSDPNGRVIALTEYKDNSEWPSGADGEGGSLELLQVSRPNNEPNNWAVSPSGGTPNQPNARAISDSSYHDYDVVINELFYHPEEEEYDDNLAKEFIELYNQGTSAIDLSGWSFTQGVEFEFPAGTMIAANGYLIVCKDPSQYPDAVNKTGPYTLQLNNGGEALALTSDQGIVIDYVRYNDKLPWPVRPDGDGYSLELIAPSSDNRLYSNWRSGNPMSPGQPNSQLLSNAPPEISQVDFTPHHPSASTSESTTEEESIISAGDTWHYFEGKQAPPTNWNAIDFDDSSWPQGPSGFGFSDNDDNTVLNMSNYLAVYVRKTFTVSSPEEITQLILSVDYDDGFAAYLNGVEVARANIDGTILYTTAATSSHEAGTPETFDISSFVSTLRMGVNVLAVEGHNNSLSSSDFSLIPALSSIQEISAGEEGADPVVITAHVQDDEGLQEVQLHYQRCSAPLGTGLVMEDWKSAPMFDDGTGGDAVAGDGIYSYRLNYAETLRPREIWRFTISAKDTAGQESVLPLSEEKTQTYAFFVEDRLDLPPFSTIYLFVERTVLDWLNRNTDSNDEQPSIVVIDGDVYDLVNGGGIRYTGGSSANKPKKSWRIRFPKDNRWQNRRAYDLNADYQTSPLLRGESGFLEHLASTFMQEAGVPTADTTPYRVMLNNSYYGLFLGVEQYDEDFLDHHGLSSETRIFKTGLKDRVSSMSKESNFDFYADQYENTIGREEDITDLITFIETMNDATDLQAFFETHVDVETYLNYLVCVAVLSHVDSAEKNYFPVHGDDGRWFVMPGDMSHTWGEVSTNDAFPLISTTGLLDGAEGGLYGINQMQRLFLSVPEYRALYYQRLRDFTSHLFTREHLDSLLDAYWNTVQDAIHEDVQRWNSPGQVDLMVAEIKNYITARIAFILSDANITPTGTPPAPVNQSPIEGATLTTRSFDLKIQIPSGQTAVLIQWEIQEGGSDFFNSSWMGESDSATIHLPGTSIASNNTYYWRARYQNEDGLWSDWSQPTSLKTSSALTPPDVENVVITPMDESVRIEWTLPTASDLIRVDILLDDAIVESTPIDDNRVRIQDLVNGQLYQFVIRTVTSDHRTSAGVKVSARPVAPVADGNPIAYFRFENNAEDSVGLFPDGTLLGTASIGEPAAANPVPLTKQTNAASLDLEGADGNGFEFGSNESYLDVNKRMTLECYALLKLNALTSAVLLDRYDESDATVDGVWRFGIGLSNPGTVDFFFNDRDAVSGYNGRLHVASEAGTASYDGLFHHYAAVIDLSQSLVSEKVRLYLDGHLLQTSIIHDDGVSDYDRLRDDSNLPILIGARRLPGGTTADVVPGRIDEVRMTAGVLEPQAFLIGPAITEVGNWSIYE